MWWRMIAREVNVSPIRLKDALRLIKEVEAGNASAVMHVGDFAYDLHDEGGACHCTCSRPARPALPLLFSFSFFIRLSL